MKNLILLAAFIGCVFGQQNLCGTRTGTELIFVNDPADGTSYLWCNFDATQNLQSVHQGNCPGGFFFNPAESACDALFTTPAICTDSNIDPLQPIRVAEAADAACQTFFVCQNGVQQPTIFNCTAPLVFNRNFGFCTSEEIAPCTGSAPPGPPSGLCTAPGFFEDLRRNNCADFLICNNDLQAYEVSCNAPFHFNPAVGGCQDPASRNPPCPFSSSRLYELDIPTPPLINVPQALEQKLRSRFANVFRN